MREGNLCPFRILYTTLWLLLCATPLMHAQGNSGERGRSPFPQIQLARQARNGEAIQALGDRLPEVAAWYGKSTAEMVKLLRQDPTLWVSRTGRLLYICEIESSSQSESARLPQSTFPLEQTFKLHSLPGSQRTIYLDFNGATISGTAWNSGFNKGAPIVAAPFSLDADPATFNTTEMQMIQNIWKRVAEDYSPFDVDVTTEEPPPDVLLRSSSSDLQYGNRVVITPTSYFYPNVGGVSYVGTFNEVGETYKTSWVFPGNLSNNEKYIAEACSHENGHSAGLNHQGTAGSAYYTGQGDWAPIMGNPYYVSVTQWAKGEYAGANNTEDELSIMQGYGLAYYPDDHGNSVETATTLNGPTSLRSSGFIERNTDVDMFKFLAGNGPVSLYVNAATVGANLNILAELRDSRGSLLVSSDPTGLNSSISTTVPAGTYYLSVSGVGAGDPFTTGYSDYGSLGQYVITGIVTDPGNLDTIAPAVSILSPLNGTVSGNVTISVYATDNVKVTKVELYVDGNLTSTSTSSPFSTTWNAKKASRGSHTLYCKAYDAAGNMGMSQKITLYK